jgi:uncharacterized protein YbjT (DUF2867 family)
MILVTGGTGLVGALITAHHSRRQCSQSKVRATYRSLTPSKSTKSLFDSHQKALLTASTGFKQIFLDILPLTISVRRNH